MIEITETMTKELLPKRIKDSHKGTYGKVLNIVGSSEYFGAAILCSTATMRTGAGYSILCSDRNYNINCSQFSPNLIYCSHNNFDIKEIINLLKQNRINSIVLGCGISTQKHVVKFVDEFLSMPDISNIPIVIDADGLNCISQLAKTNLPSNTILTPHPKELSKLIGVSVDDIQDNREKFAKIAREKYNSTIILKGNNTVIACKDGNIYKNTTGNSALAKAGTGDVLSGMLGGFLAQNISIKNASILAVYLHGLSGDLYTEKYSEYSMLATDLLDFIPLAFRKLSHQ